MQYIRPSVSIARGYRPVSRSRKDYPKKKQPKMSVVQKNIELRSVLKSIAQDYHDTLDAIEYLCCNALHKDIPYEIVDVLGDEVCRPKKNDCVDAIHDVLRAYIKLKSEKQFWFLTSIALFVVIVVQFLIFGGIL